MIRLRWNPYSRLTLVIRWSYGYRVLLAPDPALQAPKTIPDETTPLNKPSPRESIRSYDCNQDYYSTSQSTRSASTDRIAEILERQPLHSSSRESLTSFPALSVHSGEIPSNRLSSTLSTGFRRVVSLMNPPLWAVLASVIVAVITPLQQELFFNKTGFLHNSLFLAIDTAGAVGIPMILVSLGASLVKSRETVDESIAPSEIDIKMENRGIFLSLFARMAMVPLLMYPVLIPTMYWGITYPHPL